MHITSISQNIDNIRACRITPRWFDRGEGRRETIEDVVAVNTSQASKRESDCDVHGGVETRVGTCHQGYTQNPRYKEKISKTGMHEYTHS